MGLIFSHRKKIYVLCAHRYEDHSGGGRIVAVSENLDKLKDIGKSAYERYDDHALTITACIEDELMLYTRERMYIGVLPNEDGLPVPEVYKYEPSFDAWYLWENYLDEALDTATYEGLSHLESGDEGLLLSGVLGCCGCGTPEDGLRYIAKGLAHFTEDGVRAEYFKEWNDFSNEEATFFLYMMDVLGITEHGSSIYGSWLTEKGKALVKSLIKLGYMQDPTSTDTEE